MIVYHEILQRLAAAGYSSYRIRKEQLLPESTLTRLRTGEAINMASLDTICRLLDCQPGDLISWEPDGEKER